MKHDNSELCEACRQFPIETVIENDDLNWPYRLCFACAHRLVTHSLRPLEWFRLATIHGPSQHHLHDDFYSEEGEALQPKGEITELEKWSMPTLSQADLETLIDYAITRFILSENDVVIDSLKQHNTASLLSNIQKRVYLLPPIEIEARIYIICAYTLGFKAESWIRACWMTYRSETFVALATASSYCLPLAEGFEKVIEVLETLSPHEFRRAYLVLINFHIERTLDWLENHIQSPVTTDWGRLAASSQFSWERAVKWLDSGRPLSLVALDALEICYFYEVSHPEDATNFFRSIPKDDIRTRLEIYLRQDPVPRVKQIVTRLIKHIGS